MRIKETKDVYEGEVTELTPVESEGSGAGYGRVISAVVVGLRTSKGAKQLKLDPSIHDALTKERVAPGDVIYIEAASGSVKRVGRCDAYATEFDLEADEYVPLPKGDVHKRREVVQDVTLHDLDSANAAPAGGRDVLSLMAGLMRPRKTEVTERLRAEVDRVVEGFVDAGTAEVVPGVLFVDEAHMLDADCFTFLNRALESAAAPVVVLATNRGLCRVRGTQELAPHGVPLDFLDRLVIVRTQPYTRAELAAILALRAATEGVDLGPAALDALAELGERTSLRHAAQLLSPAKVLAGTGGREQVEPEDVQEASALFWDAKASAKRLLQQADKFLA